MIKNYLKRIFIFGGFMIAGFTASSQVTTFEYTGESETYEVPAGVTAISIQTYGAQGGNTNGGFGAGIYGEFTITPGDVLNIVVGGQGTVNSCGGAGASGGGGGGTFVWNPTDDALPLIAAGGGGGGNQNWAGECVNGLPGQAGEDGTSGAEGDADGGIGGHGGAGDAPSGTGSGGGGWLSVGQNSTWGDGCTGGSTLPDFTGGLGAVGMGEDGDGGFGGGGGAVCGCGGGGGYSGGAGGNGNTCRAGGGGGGSYNQGTAQNNETGVNEEHGQVIITILCDPLTLTPFESIICLGDELILDATSENDATITWDMDVENGISFTPTTTGIITYTATSDGADCPLTIDIEILDSPVITYEITHEDAGGDGAIDITVTGGITPYIFDWDNDGTGDFDDTEDLTGLTNGIYIIVVEDNNECEASESIELVKHTGVFENETSPFSIYPNPTTNVFTIATEGHFSYQVIGINGDIMLNGTGIDKAEVSLSEFAKGVYFVKLKTNDKTHILEIVKK